MQGSTPPLPSTVISSESFTSLLASHPITIKATMPASACFRTDYTEKEEQAIKTCYKDELNDAA